MRLRFRRKRQELLGATEKSLAVIAKAVCRAGKPLRGADKIGLRVGKVIGRYKMAKHFRIEISEKSFGYERDVAAIAAEAALDGFYVIRTNVPPPTLDAERTVRAYKGLSRVERAFRCLKSNGPCGPVDLHGVATSDLTRHRGILRGHNATGFMLIADRSGMRGPTQACMLV